VAGRGGNISVNWNQNDTLWLRWAERNDVANDHGLAIDDLRFSAGSAPAPVPVPPALGLLALGAAALHCALLHWRVVPPCAAPRAARST
jgi:MYXO-CTERM domain-containing protein